MRIVSIDELARLSHHARTSPRRRANLNLHPQLSDPIQRFFNAIEPGTFVRPHRHGSPDRWETFAVLTGSAVVLTFDAHGRVLERCDLAPCGPCVLVEIPGGAWHALAATTPGTVLLELKPGPYQPIDDKDFATWAPCEGDPGAVAFELWYRAARPGDEPPRVDARAEEPA